MRKTTALTMVLLPAVVAFALHADTVVLMDGTEHEGEILRDDADGLTLKVHMGAMEGKVVIAHKDIKSIKRSSVAVDPAFAEGQQLVRAAETVTEIPKAIDSWLKAGRYFDLHAGFSSQSRAAYEKVLLLDSENPVAREKLGYVKSPTGWVNSAEIRKAEREKERIKRAESAKIAAIESADDDIVIAVKSDNQLIKQIRDAQVARARVDARPVVGEQPPPMFDNNNPGFSEYYGLPYYPSILSYTGYGFAPYGFGYGFNNYGCGCYSSGLSFGFHGKWGSVRFNGNCRF